MGKYGIGSRVRDKDGDVGTIVGKRKGERQVQYEGLVGGRAWLNGESIWWSKSSLTPIADNAADWQPKVGDRVRVKDTYLLRAGMPIGAEGIVTMVPGGDHFYADISHPHDGVVNQVVSKHNVEPLPVAAEAQGEGVLQLAEGKFYRDADGCKIGPMWEDDVFSDGYAWDCAGSNGYWNDQGKSQFGSDPDLVSEWVDEQQAVEPVAVAPATAAPAEPAGKFKVGDRVRSVSDECVDITIGNVYVVTGIESGGMIEFLDDGGDDRVRVADRYELVEPADTPVSAVGTSAGTTTITTGSLVTLAIPAIVTGIDRSHAHLQLASGGSYTLPVAALVPAA